MKRLLKDSRGLTLIELLAVVVILGIIAAIAVPAIANIIGDTEEDAHVANAEQMINAARTAYAAGEDFDAEDDGYTLDELVSAGYIEQTPSNPFGSEEDYNDDSFVRVDPEAGEDENRYEVTLNDPEDDGKHIDGASLDDLQGDRDELFEDEDPFGE
ncbi:type IV pilus assembly protein PilA [Salsuginibacillus halophilus]|uniref:Type IV pilus assembly protein PilA n=1 Tax=Salsuginibacillus halophilus TaxID=517424 RepID=A0A2P8HCM1_9BACI|nr:prepilin-type N-terminal cleavage/methylation domain-containing protein [Salsuginibacillus halophilus]PSL43979.1 type IV pilus assembly protein PilA [Salsuginibacillus halophilus]